MPFSRDDYNAAHSTRPYPADRADLVQLFHDAIEDDEGLRIDVLPNGSWQAVHELTNVVAVPTSGNVVVDVLASDVPRGCVRSLVYGDRSRRTSIVALTKALNEHVEHDGSEHKL